MLSIKAVLFALSLLAGPSAAQEGGEQRGVVIVEYRLSEQSPERVEQLVVKPAERLLAKVARVAMMRTVATHGRAAVAIHFDGGATAVDRDAVEEALDRVVPDASVEVLSRTIRLGTDQQARNAGI